MRLFLIAVVVLAASAPARAVDVGISVNIGQPGYYGRVDTAGYPQPQLLYSQPRMIQRGPSSGRQPIYLRVPPGHAKNWHRHCASYNACNERVYFVRDSWYQNQYVPRYQERNRHRQDERHDARRHDHRDNDRDDRRHDHRDNDRDDRHRGDNDRGQHR